ncbi:MAG: RDD family protein [Chitinophagaceae bacterium]|nr:MAG: RDD family protein [Chitinophagaceae bacterium]
MEQYNQPTDLLFDLEQPVAYAGFWERFGAVLIDGFILMILQVILYYSVSYDASNLISIVMSWLYFAIMESGTSQATIGKKALGLKVTNAKGERISFGQATGRYFGKILSSLILLIGYLMMIWDAKKQTLHDKMADTYVVKS